MMQGQGLAAAGPHALLAHVAPQASAPAPTRQEPSPALLQKTQERQQQISRVLAVSREETRALMRELHKQQGAWRDELAAKGVLVGLPSFRGPTGLTVRRRLCWRTSEREALKRQLCAHGLGKWKEIHTCLCAANPGFKHGAGDVEDACWQLLSELQLLLPSHADRAYLARLMAPVADRAPFYTPGAPFKVSAVCGSFIRRLQLLEEWNMLMAALLRSEAVAGYFRALLAEEAGGLSDLQPPAAWWDGEADIALLVGLHRHGLTAFEEVRRDPELVGAFQGFHERQQRQQQAPSPAGDDTTTTSTTNGKQQAEDQQDHTCWPPDEVLAPRVRRLCTLLAQAVVLAETQGLLMPITAGEGLALSERLLQLPPSEGYVAAAATFFDDLLWQDEEEDLLADILCDSDEWSENESGGEDEQGGQGQGLYGRGRGRGRRGGGRGRGRVSQAARLAEEAAAFGAVLSSAQDDDNEEGDGGEGAGGRRRAWRPNSRYVDHVLLPVAVEAKGGGSGGGAGGGGAGGGGGGHTAAAAAKPEPEVKGPELAKRQRKDLLALLFTWGPPPAATGQQQHEGDESGGSAAAAAASAGGGGQGGKDGDGSDSQQYNWQGWSGRAEFSGALRQASDRQLTAMLKELTTEMETLIAAASGTKPRNSHAPTCQCVVCTTRRRAEERKQQEAAAAGGGAGGSDGGAAAAAAAAGGSAAAAADEEQQGDEDDGAAGAKTPALAKGENMTAAAAARLQERLDHLRTLQQALQELAETWYTQAKCTAAAKDLPGWWKAVHDGALMQGVAKHGYGNWTAICEDDSFPFKSAAEAAGADVYSGGQQQPGGGGSSNSKPAAQQQPDWMPDPKVLNKRAKSLVNVMRKMMQRQKSLNEAKEKQKQQKQAAAGAPRGGAAAAAAAGGGGVVGAAARGPRVSFDGARGGGGAVAIQPQQGLVLLPPNPAAAGAIAQLARQLGTGPVLLQALKSAAAQGNPQLLTEFLRQQQAAQHLLQQQQAAAAAAATAGPTVLGKRGAAAAGLPEGGSITRPAPGAQQIPPAAAAAAGTGTGTGGLGLLGGAGGSLRSSISPRPLSPEESLAVARQLPLVKRDAAGAPVVPLVLSRDLMIIAFGRVQPSPPAFHSASYIFPVGYTATCTYPSSITAGGVTRYTTTIAQGSEGAPLFVVVAADAPGRQWVAASAAGVWQVIHTQVQGTQQGMSLPPVDGVTQMGLTQPLVSMLIQELPGVAACSEFKPELSPAPPHLVAAIRQHQAVLQQQAAVAAGGGVAPVGVVVPAAATGAVAPQQALAAQLLLLQQQQAQQSGQPGQLQQQQAMMQALQQQQRQAMQQQQQPGSALQQQQLLQQQQQLMQRLTAMQQQQQQQQQQQRPPGA